MTLDRVKLGRAVTFMKYIPCWFSLFNIYTGNFNLKYNQFSGIKFAESCRAGGK